MVTPQEPEKLAVVDILENPEGTQELVVLAVVEEEQTRTPHTGLVVQEVQDSLVEAAVVVVTIILGEEQVEVPYSVMLMMHQEALMLQLMEWLEVL